MCGRRQSSYTPNPTAAKRNWRRQTQSSCRLDSQCSGNREEEEEKEEEEEEKEEEEAEAEVEEEAEAEEEEERFRDFRMRTGHKRQSWEHWTDSLVPRMNQTESISDLHMCFR